MLTSSVDDDEFEFQVCAILSGHTQDVKFVKWHPTENLLFSSSYDNTIKCWEYSESIDDWICKYTIEGHKSTVWQMTFDKTGDFMCSCGEDMSWAVWKVSSTGYTNKGFITNTHLRPIYSIDWNEQDQIVTGGADNRICVFELSREALEDDAVKNLAYNQIACFDMAHDNDINSVQWCPSESKMFASCSDDQQIKFWQVNSEE